MMQGWLFWFVFCKEIRALLLLLLNLSLNLLNRLPNHVRTLVIKEPALEKNGQKESTSVCIAGKLTIISNAIAKYFKTTLTLAGFTLEVGVGYVYFWMEALSGSCN